MDNVKYNGLFSEQFPLVMGIVNITPDSFSDGGKYNNLDAAVEHCRRLVEDGAKILDFGGESTRPGALKVSEQEELGRVIPVIEKIRPVYPNVYISVDTYKSAVAEQAIKAGADIINDISGGLFDPEIVSVAIKYDKPLVINHITNTPDKMQENLINGKILNPIKYKLLALLEKYRTMGLQKAILDPGIGFGKTISQNFEILNGIKELKTDDTILLIGLSRKTFIGKTFNLEPDERDSISGYLEFFSILQGADIIRTHEPKKVINAIQLFRRLTGIEND